MNSFHCGGIFFKRVGWWRLGTRQKMAKKGIFVRTDSVCGGFVGVVSGGLGSRQNRAETSSLKHRKGFFAAAYAVSPTC